MCGSEERYASMSMVSAHNGSLYLRVASAFDSFSAVSFFSSSVRAAQPTLSFCLSCTDLTSASCSKATATSALASFMSPFAKRTNTVSDDDASTPPSAVDGSSSPAAAASPSSTIESLSAASNAASSSSSSSSPVSTDIAAAAPAKAEEEEEETAATAGEAAGAAAGVNAGLRALAIRRKVLWCSGLPHKSRSSRAILVRASNFSCSPMCSTPPYSSSSAGARSACATGCLRSSRHSPAPIRACAATTAGGRVGAWACR
mmetsp:Transcript_75037/g.142235  ORF Transcript_75037/g.142235 Transcript_75037/m.142235 type:complete len:259 (+) Transcript_75037:231-1007(+)